MSKGKNSYDAKVDSKNRITLRNAKYDYYRVTEMADGSFVLYPRVLVDLSDIPEETLAMIESSMKNYKKGVVSDPFYFKENQKRLKRSVKQIEKTGGTIHEVDLNEQACFTL